MALSPGASSAITGFALSAPTSYSTSSDVFGKVYAADYAAPTAAMLATAGSDMNAAYADAAGRTSPDFKNLGGGNLNGLTLLPGLYKFDGDVTIPASVSLTGGENDIWIFHVAGNLSVADRAVLLLRSGAQARNVYWQVAGQTTLGAGSIFRGIVLSRLQITMHVDAAMQGRLLSQSAVTLNAAYVEYP